MYHRVVLVDHAVAQYYAVVGAGGHTADQRSRRGIVSHSGAGGTTSGPRCSKLPKSGAGGTRRSQEATPKNRENRKNHSHKRQWWKEADQNRLDRSCAIVNHRIEYV